MTTQLICVNAIYENGALKLHAPLPGFADGDRVELALVRVAPDRGRDPVEEPRPRAADLVTPDDEYDVLEAMNATRLRQGERPLIPPTEAR